MTTLLEQLKDRTIDMDNYYTITVNNGHEEKILDVKIKQINDRYNNCVVEVLGDLPRGQMRNTAISIVHITDIQEIGDPILKGGRRKRKSCKKCRIRYKKCRRSYKKCRRSYKKCRRSCRSKY
jgi:hypothetical protein